MDTRGYKGLLGVTSGNKGLHGVRRTYKGVKRLQDVTRGYVCYKGLP